MNIYKKTLITTFISLGALIPIFVFADAYGLSTAGETAGLSQLAISTKSIPQFAGEIVGVGLSLVGIVFFLLMLYAGIRWMIAGGKSEDVQKAKDTLEAAAIGLVIVLSAYAITQFVFSSLLSGSGGGPGPAGGGGIQACVKNADCSGGGVCVGGFCQGASGPTPLVPQNCADCCQDNCLLSYPNNVDDCRVECQACKDSARVAYSDAYNNCTMKGCADFRVGIEEVAGDCKSNIKKWCWTSGVCTRDYVNCLVAEQDTLVLCEDKRPIWCGEIVEADRLCRQSTGEVCKAVGGSSYVDEDACNRIGNPL